MMTALVIVGAAVVSVILIGAAALWTYSRAAFWFTAAGVALMWLVVVPNALEVVIR